MYRPSVIRYCRHCGKPFKVFQKEISKGRGFFCSYSCDDIYRRGTVKPKFKGANNPSWKGGRWSYSYSSKIEDKCKICGATEDLKYFHKSSRARTKNIISVYCRTCIRMAKNKRRELIVVEERNRRIRLIKEIFAIGILILLSVSVMGYKVKYYDNKINKTECNNTLNSINQSYFKGLKQISIMNVKHPALAGEYYPNVIYITVGCDKGVIIHELAHHLQWVRKDTWAQMLRHTGHFEEYMEEIR